MSLGRLNFESVSEQDLRDLIAAGVPEGLSVEYKRDPYGRADADVKEFLKDVTALANSVGGHIVIGIDETGGLPTNIKPISEIDQDSEIQRMESLLRDGVEPRISGVRIRAVSLSSGGYILVLRVPRSWNPPHRVSARGTNRFYVRNSAGSHEASVDEIRVLFNLSANEIERVRSVRSERVAKILADEGPVSLAADRGKLIVHIVPLSAFSSLTRVDLNDVSKHHGLLRPISTNSMTPRFNFDGFINVRGGVPCFGYTQVFRNGVVEATKCGILRAHNGVWHLPMASFEGYLIGATRNYLSGMKMLGIHLPLVIMITLEGMHGSVLGTSDHQDYYDPPQPILRSILELPEVLIESYGSPADYDLAIRPAIDAIWNAGGHIGSRNYDASGKWSGSPA
jgi:hypothetical protein